MKYYAINFANGLGHDDHTKPTGGRIDPEMLNSGNTLYRSPSTVPLGYETHGGDDVAVYASGPWSHLFTGTFEQNAIPEILAFAACIGTGKTVCNEN